MSLHDHGYKQLFFHPEMVEDLLRGFVGEDFVNELDFTTLKRGNGQYISDDLRERTDDVIWSLRFGDTALTYAFCWSFRRARISTWLSACSATSACSTKTC